MTEANFIDKSILAKRYGNQPGGSLHDVYVVEIDGVYEGYDGVKAGARKRWEGNER